MPTEPHGPPTTGDVPVAALLHSLLTRISNDIPGSLGVALSVSHGDDPLTVLMATGISEQLAPAQTQLLGGPIPDAAATEDPTFTDDVFADPRWPALTLTEVTARFPEQSAAWPTVRGVAALPSNFHDGSTLVISAALEHTDISGALRVLARYENLVIAALVVAEAHTDAGTEQMIALLRSRAILEQAKGAIIAIGHCTSDDAWATLRRASQQFNVKVRELAAALIEHLGQAPASTPEGLPAIIPTAAARRAAELLWSAFTTPPAPTE